MLLLVVNALVFLLLGVISLIASGEARAQRDQRALTFSGVVFLALHTTNVVAALSSAG